MPAAEYIIVLASILVGLALADWATSLHRILRAGSKVQWHWATVVFAILVLLSILEFWWSAYFALPAIRTIADFIIPMVQLIVLFLLASAAWPDEIPDEGLSLQDYYFATHRYSWSLFTAYVVLATVVQFINGGLSIANMIGALLVASLAVWKNRWLHYGVLIFITAVSVMSFTGRELPV